MRTYLWIALGFVLAIVIAVALVPLRYIGVDPKDVAASSGMWAFGDLVFICGVAALLSLVPGFFLLRALRRFPRLWVLPSIFTLLWSASAPVAVAFRFLSATRTMPMFPDVLAFFRIWTSLFFLPLALAGALNAPTPSSRTRFAWASVLELIAAVSLPFARLGPPR